MMNNDPSLQLLFGGGYNPLQSSSSAENTLALEASGLSGVQGLSTSTSPFMSNDLLSDSGGLGAASGLLALGMGSQTLQSGLDSPSNDLINMNNMLSNYSNALNSYADADDADDDDDDGISVV